MAVCFTKTNYGCNVIRTHNHLVRKETLNHLAKVSLTKWLSVHLRTKWLRLRIALQSLKLQISRLFQARSSLTFRQLWSVDSLKEHTDKILAVTENILNHRGENFFVNTIV